MSVAAQRFRYLDNETNVPIADLSSITGNYNFNIPQENTQITSFDFNNSGGDILKSLSGSLEDLKNLNFANVDFSGTIDKVLASISKLDLPDFVKDAFSFLKDLDLDKLKGFVKDAFDIGMVLLCNSLDFLKNFMLGKALTNNVLSGLLIAFLLSLLDKICDAYLNKNVRQNASHQEQLDYLIPPKNNITNANAYNEFKGAYSDYLQSNPADYMTPNTSFNTDTFLTNATTMTASQINTAVNGLADNEFSSDDRSAFLSALDTKLTGYQPTSAEYSNLLRVKGDFINLPPVSPIRSNKSIGYQYLKDKLGKLSQALPNITVNQSQAATMSAAEQAIFANFTTFQQTVTAQQAQFNYRSLQTGSFDDIDFSTLLPVATTDMKNSILGLNIPGTSHRWRDLSPTSERVFAS